MSEKIDSEPAEQKALETLFELTEETAKGVRSEHNIPSEVRLGAAKELLDYGERNRSVHASNASDLIRHRPLSSPSYLQSAG